MPDAGVLKYVEDVQSAENNDVIAEKNHSKLLSHLMTTIGLTIIKMRLVLLYCGFYLELRQQR